jgi:outer membrane protein assembly factor BamB
MAGEQEPDLAPKSGKAGPAVPGYGPPRWIKVVLGILAGLAVIARWTDVLRDNSMSNVALVVMGLLAFLITFVWFALRSRFSRKVRVASSVGLVACLALFLTLFRVNHISGELVPAFEFRFSGRPAPGAMDFGALRADLRTTTDRDFPEFLGPGRHAAVEHVQLARDWSDQAPVRMWRQPIGAAWSGFAVVNGCAVTMEQRADQEMVTCYELETGRPVWAHATATRYETLAGGVGPRCTPTMHEGMVYTLGANGHLTCLDGADGKPRWQKHLWQEFGMTAEDDAATLAFGRSNSPLVVGDLVVVPVGGPSGGPFVSLAAYDRLEGKLVWKAGNRNISFASPSLVTLAGVEQILIVNEDTVSGHVLWEHPWPGRSKGNASVSQAVPIDADRVFLSKGYGIGASLIQVTRGPQGFSAAAIWKSTKVMRSKFTNVALYKGLAYGLSDGVLECVDPQTGRQVWKQGRYGHGQLLRVGDSLLVVSESGEVLLIEATPERTNHVLGRFQAIEGMTWNTLALAGPFLLVRNAEEAACYKLPVK